MDTFLTVFVLRRDDLGLLDELARAFARAAGIAGVLPPSMALQDREFPGLCAEGAVWLCAGRHWPHALLAMRLPDWAILEMLWPASGGLAVADVLRGQERALVGRRTVRIRETSSWTMATEPDPREAALIGPWARMEKDGDAGWLLTGPAQSQELHDLLFRDHFVVAWLVLELGHRHLREDLRLAARVLPVLPLADDADRTWLSILENIKRDSLGRWQGDMQRFIDHFQVDRQRSWLVAQYERVVEEIDREAAPLGPMPEPDNEAELTALLIDAFDGDAAGLRRWVRLHLGAKLHHELRDDLALAELAFQVILAIRRHGLAGPELFAGLSWERPALARRIRELARRWSASGARPIP